MIIAAEASSAHYALKLMREFKKSGHEYEFFGVGSDLMEQEGFERFGKSEEMAVVGAVEILKHFKSLKKIFNKLVEEAICLFNEEFKRKLFIRRKTLEKNTLIKRHF